MTYKGSLKGSSNAYGVMNSPMSNKSCNYNAKGNAYGLESKIPNTIYSGKPQVYDLDSKGLYQGKNSMAPYILSTMALALTNDRLADKIDELIELYKEMLSKNQNNYFGGDQMAYSMNDLSNLAFGNYSNKGGYFKHPESMKGTDINDYNKKKDNEKAKETVMKNDGDLRIFNVSDFVNGITKVVENEDEIMQYVKEAYYETTGNELPNNISINLCDEQELKRNHNIFNGGEWNPGIQGFCINRGLGNSQVFVKKDELAKTLLVVGHELGHLQTFSLNPVEEEAKAYAFSIEWMNKIKENNIANLGNVLISENPALNGLHNVAYDYVVKLIRQGKTAWDVFTGLIENTLRAC
ncbi:hypothetical protein KY334_01885 [Candidatus Woesearchaeota archaeon]|nr:hypothetical protein [Candidatus Woesearchaeota archaeon]